MIKAEKYGLRPCHLSPRLCDFLSPVRLRATTGFPNSSFQSEHDVAIDGLRAEGR